MQFLMGILFFASTVFGASLYEVKDQNIKGETFKMSELKGKTVLIVNIASQCGYTKQLGDLEKLYQKYKNKGFVVLGVPTNDFGGQTPEDDQGVLEFCQKNYDVTFPILKKKTILGKDQRELYKVLTAKPFEGDVKWNFEKFLIDKNGKIVARYQSKVTPDDSELVKKIESIL